MQREKEEREEEINMSAGLKVKPMGTCPKKEGIETYPSNKDVDRMTRSFLVMFCRDYGVDIPEGSSVYAIRTLVKAWIRDASPIQYTKYIGQKCPRNTRGTKLSCPHCHGPQSFARGLICGGIAMPPPTVFIDPNQVLASLIGK